MQLQPEWPSFAVVPQSPQHPCQLLLILSVFASLLKHYLKAFIFPRAETSPAYSGLLQEPSWIMLEAVLPGCLWISKQPRNASDFWSSCLHSLSMGTRFYGVLGVEARASCKLGKHSANWCTSLPSPCSYSLTHSVVSEPGHTCRCNSDLLFLQDSLYYLI